MEKYAKLLKGLQMCAGPECCKDGCPYYGETMGGMTCRARLLLDANIAIDNEQALRESAEEGLRNAVEQIGDLEAANNTIRDERDKLNENITCIIRDRDDMAEARDMLRKECTSLRERCQVQRNEIDALVLRLGQAEGQKPEPDRDLAEAMEIALKATADANYWRGQADALKWYIQGCGVEYGTEDVDIDLPDLKPPELEDDGHV